VPVSFPRDDSPHDAVTEWWYHTGHLEIEEGRFFGFEQVTFKGVRGSLAGYASHVAITDGEQQRLTYDQRAAIDNGSIAKPGEGFDLTIGDWMMRGRLGHDVLAMSLSDHRYQLDLTTRKPPVLPGGDAYIRTNAGSESYYHSRTRLSVTGTLSVEDVDSAVTGEAWMDHQWGRFTSFSEGGWDWFSVQLDDDTEAMIYQLRDIIGAPWLGVGTYVTADGSADDRAPEDIVVEVNDTWTSPHSGATYPMVWNLHLSFQALSLSLRPVMEDQELDTRQTTRVTYGEG
jgi:predicted secreted hydrolase